MRPSRSLVGIAAALVVAAIAWALARGGEDPQAGDHSGRTRVRPAPRRAVASSVSTIVAQVSAADGAVGDVRVCVGRGESIALRCERTDGEGRARLEVEPGLWSVRAGSPGACGGETRMVSVESGAEHPVELALGEPNCTIDGHLRDVFGGEISGGIVNAGPTWSVTDDTGRFCLCEPPGVTTLDFQATEYLPTSARVAVPIHGLGVTLEPAVAIAGRVVWEDGTPAEDAWVSVGTRAGRVRVPTGPDGVFEATTLAPGRLEVRAEHDRGRSALRPAIYLGPGGRQDQLELVLLGSSHVSGTLRVGDEPCKSGRILIVPRTFQTEPPWARVGPGGAFEILGTDPGRYQLQLHCDEPKGSDLRQIFEVHGPTDGLEWSVEACPGHSVRGRVVGPQGASLAGIGVGADRDGTRLAHTVTGPGGEFELRCIDPGEVRVAVPFSNDDASRTQLLVASADVDGLELRLPDAGQVRGRLVFPDMELPSPATIRLVPTERGESLLLHADETGHIPETPVPLGTYTAVVTVRGGIPYAIDRLDPDPIRVAPGVSTAIGIELAPRNALLDGLVVDGFDHPVEAAHVTARDGTTPLAFGVTDLDGRFELRGLPPRALVVDVQTRDGRTGESTDVMPGEPVRVVLEGRRSIYGRAERSDDGAIPRFQVTILTGGDRRSEWFERTDGDFALDVPTGPVDLEVTHRDWFGRVALEAARGDGDPSSPVVVRLHQKRSICGRVTDSSERPLPGIYVLSETLGNRASSRTDAEGRFELSLPLHDDISLRFVPGPTQGTHRELTRTFDPPQGDCSVGTVVLGP